MVAALISRLELGIAARDADSDLTRAIFYIVKMLQLMGLIVQENTVVAINTNVLSSHVLTLTVDIHPSTIIICMSKAKCRRCPWWII